jgi:hypothetical protein
MPKRTNEFQQVIHSIYLQLHTDADVQESRFLKDGVTGTEREVDVVIQTKPPTEMLIGVECNRKGRRATVEWVEQMMGKHLTLPTNRLILVTKAGFTVEAKRKAQACGIETLTLAEAKTVNWTQVVGKLARVAIALPHIQLVTVIFSPPVDASAIDLHSLLYSPEETPQGSLGKVADARLDRPKAQEQLYQIAREPGDHTFNILHTPPAGSYIVDNIGRKYDVRHLIFRLAIHIDPPIGVDLEAHTFQGVQVAVGSFELPHDQALLTVVEEEGKPLSADLRLAPKKKKK